MAFIPGWRESGSTWFNLIEFLEDSLDIEGKAIFLETDTTYTAQAQQLKGLLISAAVSDAPGVAHSNGGVVARLYTRNYTDRRLDGLLTVGTPHRGVPLARQGNIDFARAWLAQLVSAVEQALIFYTPPTGDPNFYNLEFPVGYSGLLMVTDWDDILDAVLFDLVTDVFWWETVGLLIGPYVPPSNNDYVPESAVFSTINTNNWGESSKLTTRVSVSTEIPYDIAPWLMWTRNGTLAQWLVQIQGQLCYFAFSAYNYYLGHPDPVLRAGADYWAVVVQYCPVEFVVVQVYKDFSSVNRSYTFS